MASETSDQLFFFSKSARLCAGKGVNDRVRFPEMYEDLNRVRDWRKVLSNFYVSHFVYEGKQYWSVEHAFQGAKISLVDPEKGNYFCIDSGHEIGRTQNGDIARKHRKMVMLSEADLKRWSQIKQKVMEDILFCKFSQGELARCVLLATGDAQLMHGTRGTPITRMLELERVRCRLRQ